MSQDELIQRAPITGVKAQGDPGLASFGGGAEQAQALNTAGDLSGSVAGQYFERAKQQQELSDLTANYGAAAQLSELQTTLQVNALKQQGANALGITAPTMEEYRKGASKIEESLATPEQKQAFQRARFSHQVELSRVLQGHEATQQGEVAKQSVNAAILKFGDGAEVKALTDPAGSRMDLARQQASLREAAKLHGLTADAADVYVADGLSKTQARVINFMLANGQDLTAKSYFDSLPQGAIRGQDAVEVARALRSGSKLGEAQRLTDQAFAGKVTGSPINGEGQYVPGIQTMDEVNEAASKIEDPEVRKLFTAEARQRLEDVQLARRERSINAFDDIAKQMQSPANKDTNPREIATPDQWENQLTPDHRDALMRMAKRERTTDAQTEIQWWALQADPRKVAAIKQADLWTDYLSHMSEGDAKGALAQWATARKEVAGDPTKASEVKSMYDDRRMIFNAMASIGAADITASDTLETVAHKGGDKASALAAFGDKVDTAWMAFGQRNNGKIGDADRKRILAELLKDETPVAVPTYGIEYRARIKSQPDYVPYPWDPPKYMGAVTKPFKDLTEEERKNFYVKFENLSPMVVTDMTNFVNGLGKQTSQDKLQRMRRARLLGDDALFLKIANE